MVWFQCEDCGENLKKPKLANHFRGCSAQKFSCIDCGVIFNQQSVQGHTQCVSEAEKYGPKNVGFVKKETMKTTSKETNCDGSDVSLGLSTRAPWSCSLCNVKATSQETLLLHSQGKKHKSKVRSMASKMTNSKNTKDLNVKEDKMMVSSHELGEMNPCKSKQENCLGEDFSKVNDKDRQPGDAMHRDQAESKSKSTEGVIREQTREKKKKRKLPRDQDRPPSDEIRKAKSVNEGEACGTPVAAKMTGPIEPLEDNKPLKTKRKRVSAIDDVDETWISLVKWKKLIKRALTNAPNGSMKIKQLQSSILPSVIEAVKKCGLEVNKVTFSIELERQIQSSVKFVIDGKKVRLAP